MDNWIFIKNRGYPYKFLNKEQFVSFKEDLKTGLKNVGVPISDLRIQGSSLRSKNANDDYLYQLRHLETLPS